ncbi:MAG: nucleotidyltransferase family protein [Candidatus Diapherotrites archaeon]
MKGKGLKAIIPAAGYGTRLHPLTKETPKALIEIGGKPVLEHVLDKIEALSEIDSVFIVTNAVYYNKFIEWLELYETELEIKIINDKTTSNENRLGAIGDKHLAIKKGKIKEEVLDISSDNLFDFGLENAFNFFKQKKAPVIGLYDVKDKFLARHYGIVSIDPENKLTAFQEKPEHPASTLASIGVYFYTAQTIKLFENYFKEGHSRDAPGNFIEWLYKKTPVYGFTFKGKWFDIGSFEQLDKARAEFKEK